MFCWQTVFLGMGWLLSAMISRGSHVQLHIWGHQPGHHILPFVGYNSFIFQEEQKRKYLLSLLCQATCTNIPPAEQSPDLLCTWGSCLPTYRNTSCSWLPLFCSSLECLLDEGHWSWRLKVKIRLWQWKYVLILRGFNSYLRLCAYSVFCLTIVSRVFKKEKQKEEGNYNAQIFREWWYKG